MADTTTLAPKPRYNKWLAIALTVSVALNLAAIGWGASRFYKSREVARAPFAQLEKRFSRHLPDAAAAAFRAELEKTRQAVGPVEFGNVRRGLATALGAEPFDAKALNAAMEQQRLRMEQFHQGMQAALLAAAQAMTPEERKRYADKLSKMPKHWEKDKK